MNSIEYILLALMVLSAMWAVMTRSLLKGTIGLAASSAIITILIFRMNAPLAAVFELSVCAGLITVVFVSTISLTRPLTHNEVLKLSRARLKRFWPLIALVIVSAYAMLHIKVPEAVRFSLAKVQEADVRNILWNIRKFDMFGQIIILIAGAIGVVVLFKESKKTDE